LILTLILGAASAHAQTIIYVNSDAPFGGDGTSWATAYDSLSDALAASQSGDQIWVAAGTYVGNFTLTLGVELYGGFFGTETELTQRDWTAYPTVLDGNNTGSVIIAPPRVSATRIDGFTITNGSAFDGGGLLVRSVSSTIVNNTIVANSAGAGGGLYLRSPSATIANNTIVSNSAANGGGVFLSYSSATITNNTIVANGAVRGGGLYVGRASSASTVANTIVAFNSSGIHTTEGSAAPALRYNCVYGNTHYNYDGLGDPTGTDGNISADPRLADHRYGNVHIQPESPCVGAGSNSDALGEVDVDGQPRILPPEGNVDIGADESNGTEWWAGPYAIVRVSPAGSDANDGSSWVLAKRTIQAGIDAASELGGEVWVQAGEYDERITLRPYAHVYGGFVGAETLREQRHRRDNVTILDGRQKGSVATGRPGYAVSTIDGFTIANGSGTESESYTYGGGLYLVYSSPTITNNIIIDNSANGGGGGLYLEYSLSTMTGNTITANDAHFGGGLSLVFASPTIANNTITANSAGNGGALSMWRASPMIANNSIIGNEAVDGGGAHLYESSPTIANTIVAFNSSGIHANHGDPTLRHNCVYGNAAYNYDNIEDPTGIDGNISADPLLADLQYGNVHIQPDSPCVDAGHNADAIGEFDFDGEPRIQPTDGTADIGADESDGTLWAEGPYTVVRVSPRGDDANDGLAWGLAKRTIQAGIDTARTPGGEVWVRRGAYEERITLRPFAHLYGGFAGGELGRDDRDWRLHVTILDAKHEGSVVTARATGYALSTIDGFTITNGAAFAGGGLHLHASSPTVANNIITANNADNRGGGLFVRAVSPMIANNIITANNAHNVGGGLYVHTSSPTIIGNLIAGNRALDGGGGLYLLASFPIIVNNTITGNGADAGGGICVSSFASATITNTIVAFNSSGIYRSDFANALPTLLHNCVYDNAACDYSGLTDPTGTDGNIAADPMFAQPPDPGPDDQWGTPDDDFGDLRLSSGSPCIDAGDNAAVPADTIDSDGDGDTSEPLPLDLGGWPRFVDHPLAPDTGSGTPPIVDMGAYEYQPVGLPELKDAVLALELAHGIERSLLAKLDAASRTLEDRNSTNDVAACNAIRAFINALEALSGKHVSDAEATALIEMADQTLELLGCLDKHGRGRDLRSFEREHSEGGR
jgi:hypothetical protein